MLIEIRIAQLSANDRAKRLTAGLNRLRVNSGVSAGLSNGVKYAIFIPLFVIQ
jgi:hypothetical protein